MELQNDSDSDLLLSFITGIVAIFPGVVLLAIGLVFYFLVKKGTFKILGENIEKSGVIFNCFALLFVLIAFYICLDWVFWPTINSASPLLIVSLLFNRSAQKLNATKIFTNLIFSLQALTIFYAIASYFLKLDIFPIL